MRNRFRGPYSPFFLLSPVALLVATACSATPRAPRAVERVERASDAVLVSDPPQPAEGAPATVDRATAPDLAHPLRLEEVLAHLLARNPSVKAAQARLGAAAERYPQAIALPDPMVEATWYARNAMAPDRGFPRYNLMFKQEIPFPTVLKLRGAGAVKEAEAEGLRYEAAVRDAVAEAKEIHAERGYLAEAVRVERAIADVYRRYAEVARGGIEPGRTRLPEAFRAEALLAQAGYDVQVLAEQGGVLDQRLRALLDLPADAPVGEPADATDALPLATDTPALVARAEEHSQELRAAKVDVESALITSRRRRWELAPVFFVGGGLMKNDDYDMDTGRTEDSGVVTFGMTLPVGNPGRRAAIREADALVSAARATEAEQRQRLRSEVARVAFRLRNAARLASIYDSTLVPQAEQALLRSQEMVKEGKESLASSLELAATWQNLRLGRARAVADHAQAVAALERLLGTSAVAVPAEEPK